MSSKVVWLSHPLSPETPAYGGEEGMRIQPITQIAAGDTANTSLLILPNHLGTHVDAPRHFFDSGPASTDYPPEFWIFENPLLVDVPGDDGYLIGPKDVEEAVTLETDLLLLRTGYEKFRGNSWYWEHNPGLDPELGTWLRERFTNVRVIGMDVPGTSVLAVEDMALMHVEGQLNRVIIAPLRVCEADGGPCTVIGFIC